MHLASSAQLLHRIRPQNPTFTRCCLNEKWKFPLAATAGHGICTSKLNMPKGSNKHHGFRDRA